jgi:large subunit ribosomal protein L3
MVRGIWGKKLGMTQVYEGNKVVPVTVIDVAQWFVLRIKTIDRDGYRAVQVGRLKDRYANKPVVAEWFAKPVCYFESIREVPATEEVTLTVGSPLTVDLFAAGETVDVTGINIGRGFQGGVKRHGFRGGRASHGDKLGRKSGSLSNMRRQGRVVPGKKMPGHMGVETCTIKRLKVVAVRPEQHLLLVKGAVPGKGNTFVCVKKA